MSAGRFVYGSEVENKNKSMNRENEAKEYEAFEFYKNSFQPMIGKDNLPKCFRNRNLAIYRVIPRIKLKKTEEILRDLGYNFTIVYDNPEHSENSAVYLILPKQPLSLYDSFELYPDLPKVYKYGFELLAKWKKWWLMEYLIVDLPGVALSLPHGSQLIYGVAQDSWLVKYLSSKASNSMQRGRENSITNRMLSEILKDKILRVRIIVLASDREKAKIAVDIIRNNLPESSKKGIKIKKEKDYYKLLTPPKITRIDKLSSVFLISRFMTVKTKELEKSNLFPDPKKHPVEFKRTVILPKISMKKTGFRIGHFEGAEFRITPEELFRHAYIVGQTGSGKSNLLKVLIKNLNKSGYPVIVIDPHGSLAEELAVSTDCIFLHPKKSPFGLNPLDLLKNEDRETTVETDLLIKIFENSLELPKNAANVKYILKLTLEFLKKFENITLAGMHAFLWKIWHEKVEIFDEDFKNLNQTIKNMKDVSYQPIISILGRLNDFATNELLRRLTSSTTIDLESFIKDRKMVVFSFPESEIGNSTSRLLCSSLLLNIYYSLLTRENKDDHVFVVIDEFQILQDLPILATLFSEARKFGLHLIVAHQYPSQLSDEIFKAVINNAGCKFIFQLTEDASAFKSIDPEFAEDIVKTIPSLSTGECLVKISTSKEFANFPPISLKVDLFDEKPIRDLKDACTNEFEPKDIEPSIEDIIPILKFIETPEIEVERAIILLLNNNRKATISSLRSYFSDLSERKFREMIKIMKSRGYITKKKSGEIVELEDGFFESFTKIAPSEIGKKLTKIAVLYYLQNGYYVAAVKNVPVPRPDLFAIPFKKRYLDYSNTIEVEIEATTAEKNEEHLNETFGKVTPAKERHVWCLEEDLHTIRRYANKSNKPGKIFSIPRDTINREIMDDELPEIFRELRIEAIKQESWQNTKQ